MPGGQLVIPHGPVFLPPIMWICFLQEFCLYGCVCVCVCLLYVLFAGIFYSVGSCEWGSNVSLITFTCVECRSVEPGTFHLAISVCASDYVAAMVNVL